MKKSNVMKKVLATGLSTAMLMSVPMGTTTVFADDDPVEISIAVWDADNSFAGDEVLTAIEEELNIKITPINITWDDYYQKIPLWATSGSLPDVFVGDYRNSTSYPQWADQGVIHEIPEDLVAYPNLKTYLEGQAAQDAELNGTLYCIPRQTYPSQEWTCIDRIILYRWDLAQEAGVEKEPETWEEFQDMILKIIEADPDGTNIGGMTASDKNMVAGMLMPYASGVAVSGGSGFKWVLDEEEDLYKPAYFTENSLAAFELARNMYDSGVIEQDIALTTNQSAEEKFLQGKSAAFIIAGGFGSKYQNVARYWEEVHGSDYLDDVKALNLMPDVNGTAAYPIWDYAWSETYINAAVSDEKLDKILELYNYLLSDEGAFLSTYGPEGVLYDFDEDGKVVMHDESALVSDTYPSTGALSMLVRWTPSSYDDRFVANIPQAYTDVNYELVSQAAEVEIPEYNQRCTQLMMELGSEFVINLDDDFINLMTGEQPVEEMWNELVEQYESDGLSETITMINEALNAENEKE